MNSSEVSTGMPLPWQNTLNHAISFLSILLLCFAVNFPQLFAFSLRWNLRSDRCSRHQWLYSQETSRVYVRCSRTQSTQADVSSAVPRTAPTTKNWISVSRADETSSHEYAPQKPDRPHTRASVALRTTISEACSPTLYVLAEGGMGMAVCNASETVRVFSRNQKQQPLLVYIHA